MGVSRGDASRTKGRPPRRRAAAPREREGGGAGTRAERRGHGSGLAGAAARAGAVWSGSKVWDPPHRWCSP